MKFKDGLKIASRDLGKRKGRTFLTALAVAVGTMLIVTLVSLGTSGEKLILGEIEKSSSLKQVQVANMKYFDIYSDTGGDTDESEMFKKIDDRSIDKFGSISGAEIVQGFVGVNVDNVEIENKHNKGETYITALNNNTSYFSNVDIESVRKNNNNENLVPIIAGRNLKSSDKNAVLVGKKYLVNMGIKDYKSALGKDINITESKTENQNIVLKPLRVKGKIVGIIGDKFEKKNKIVASLDMTSQILSYYSMQKDYLKNEGYDFVVINSSNTDNISHIGNEVRKTGYLYVSYQDIIQKIESSFRIIKIILAVLGLIVLFVAAVGIVNTMIMVIYERTRSIGIMKSIGANRKDIHSIYIIQSSIIGFFGGILGLVFSIVNLNIIQFGLKMFLESKKITQTINFTMPLWLALGTLVFSIVISIIAGIYPSRKASKMDPIQALNS